MPKFSVIIPVYNVAPYLRACLDSVLAAVGRVEEGRENCSIVRLFDWKEKVEKVGGGGQWRVVWELARNYSLWIKKLARVLDAR